MKERKILPKETIFKHAYNLRKKGKVIGLTHGAFDLFHSTHLDFLIKSSKLCDYLIVGIDTDESIKTYKSIIRPVIDEESRLKIVSQVICVDGVFQKEALFLPSDMMIQLYKEIRPDIITIGDKYSSEEKIRSDAENANIKLVKIDTDQKYSTTKIIDSIISRYIDNIGKKKLKSLLEVKGD